MVGTIRNQQVTRSSRVAAPILHTFPAPFASRPARASQLRANLRATLPELRTVASGCGLSTKMTPVRKQSASRRLPILRFVRVPQPRQATPRMLAR